MPTSSSALWGNIVSSVGVFVVTAGLVATWVNQRVTPIEARIDAHDRKLESIDQKLLPELTHYVQQIATLEARQIDMQKDIDLKLNTELFKTSREGLVKQIEEDKANLVRVVDELSHQIHSLEEKIVSRAENTEHWNLETREKEDVNKSLADINARINALASTLPATSPNAPR